MSLNLITGSVVAHLSEESSNGWAAAGLFFVGWMVSMYLNKKKNEEIRKLRRKKNE